MKFKQSMTRWISSMRGTRLYGFLSFVRCWWPISWLGFISLGGSSLMLYYQALATQDLLALGIAVSLIGLTFISCSLTLLQSWIVRRSLRASATTGQLSCETGVTTATGFETSFWWFPWVHVSWNWTAPRCEVLQHDGSARQEYCWFWRRSLQEEITRIFEVSDWLGFCKVNFPIHSPMSLAILPHLGHLTTIEPLRRPTSGEDLSDPRGAPLGDRIDMRQYVKGDSPRNILWKIYARTRRLMVRIPERAVSIQPKICLYLHCNAHDEAAAATARLLIEQGTMGQNWLFASNGFAGRRTRSAEALSAIAQSGNCQPLIVGTDLSGYLQEAVQAGFTQCILILPGRLDDQENQSILHALPNQEMPIFPVIACDRSNHTPTFANRSFLKRWVWQEPVNSQMTADGVELLSQRWRNHPHPVMWLERNTGHYVSDIRYFQSSQIRTDSQ